MVFTIAVIKMVWKFSAVRLALFTNLEKLMQLLVLYLDYLLKGKLQFETKRLFSIVFSANCLPSQWKLIMLVKPKLIYEDS